MAKIDGPDFSGIVAVSPTPYTEQNTIDTDSIRRSVRLALDGGVAGFLVPAMAGEALLLTDEERRIVVETTVDEVNGRALVIAGVSADSQSTRLRNAEGLAETGCDAVLAHFACDDEEVCERNIHEVAEAVPDCLVVQDAGGKGIPVPLMAKLFREIPVFTWVKVETTGRGRKFTELQEETGGKLGISTAGYRMIEALDRGVQGYMPSILHDVYCRVFSLYRSGKRDEARELFSRLLSVLVFPFSQEGGGIRFYKRLLIRQGAFTTEMSRAEPTRLDSFEIKRSDEVIQEAIDLSGSL